MKKFKKFCKCVTAKLDNNIWTITMSVKTIDEVNSRLKNITCYKISQNANGDSYNYYYRFDNCGHEFESRCFILSQTERNCRYCFKDEVYKLIKEQFPNAVLEETLPFRYECYLSRLHIELDNGRKVIINLDNRDGYTIFNESFRDFTKLAPYINDENVFHIYFHFSHMYNNPEYYLPSIMRCINRIYDTERDCQKLRRRIFDLSIKGDYNDEDSHSYYFRLFDEVLEEYLCVAEFIVRDPERFEQMIMTNIEVKKFWRSSLRKRGTIKFVYNRMGFPTDDEDELKRRFALLDVIRV